MKRHIFKWTLRFTATGLLVLGILIGTVLNPTFLYANKTVTDQYTVYHSKALDDDIMLRIDHALEILKTSELYDSNLKFDICLNDGSLYPSLMEMFLGKAFALGFTSNKIVICGKHNFKDNYVEVHDIKWNLTQLIAHEATHCLVFHKIGFWKSNPVAHHPTWKWEGYPEYIARRDSDQVDLVKNIERYEDAVQRDPGAWGIHFADSTLSPKAYFKYRLINQYCLDIKKITYANLLKDTAGEQTIHSEMMEWYAKQKMN
jgi:hypothetical protein